MSVDQFMRFKYLLANRFMRNSKDPFEVKISSNRFAT